MGLYNQFLRSCVVCVVFANNLIRGIALNTQPMIPGAPPQGQIISAHMKSVVKLFNEQDLYYVCTVGVGTPPRYFNLQVDTGAPLTWFSSSDCQIKFCKSHDRFAYKNSSTYKATGLKAEEKYDAGSVSGIWAFETISVGNIKVMNQVFMLVNNFTDGVMEQNLSASGVLGLSMKTNNVTPILFNMFSQGLLAKPVFALHLSHDPYPKKRGEIMFGGSDSSLFEGNLTYAPIVTNDGGWTIEIQSIFVNDTSLASCKKCHGTLDVGSTWMDASVKGKNEVKKLLKIKGNYVNCKNTSTMPPIIFTIANKNFTLNATKYIFKKTEDGEVKCMLFEKYDASDKSDGEKKPEHWILGDNFLDGFYTEYNFIEKKVGIAYLKNHAG